MSELELWESLRRFTPARIGLRRSGDRLGTDVVLDLRASHALARDAVHEALDVERTRDGLDSLGLGRSSVVASAARDRAEYLRRPDLGRMPGEALTLASVDADVALVVADGLSATAVHEHGLPLAKAIVDSLGASLRVAPPVVAVHARVALSDHIGAALGVSTVVMMIGERPGLSVPASLGIYLTHQPQIGLPDSRRNCISNVHPPDGLGYERAAGVLAALVRGARELGESGVRLKDTAGDLPQ
ncbi:ethanolamine ammonia-lyase subunit EutC [Epidermidibacterium keratini]|uniref:Ethanolamine ammonia-lyase small subunit n=1 Tax=Epidermidibacterium keratini TaxID=1891644 RepID=A0A7M3T508_9ACTN|nr:ethanolamine ammonia-lyase subunit EutC [Epidermidibacterium keratini]QHB98859.1 ethanolamine ammonia-lyase subunit EutC [Epidermidibacterium keratini]